MLPDRVSNLGLTSQVPYRSRYVARLFISFSADPGRRRRCDSLISTISLESMGGILPDLHGYIIGLSQRAD